MGLQEMSWERALKNNAKQARLSRIQFQREIYSHSNTENHSKACSISPIIQKKKRKSNSQRGITSHHSEWPSVKSLRKINVEGTEKRKPSLPLLGWESTLLTGIMKVVWWKTKYRNTIGPGRSHSLAYI